MKVLVSTIFGFNVGVEVIPPDVAEEEGALWGIIIDLLFIRLVCLKLEPE